MAPNDRGGADGEAGAREAARQGGVWGHGRGDWERAEGEAAAFISPLIDCQLIDCSSHRPSSLTQIRAACLFLPFPAGVLGVQPECVRLLRQPAHGQRAELGGAAPGAPAA